MSETRPTEREKELFLDATERPPAEWEAFLAEHCVDESERTRVRRLLAAHAHAEQVLADATVDLSRSPTTTDELATGIEIDAYELVRPIGEGGFGSVWLARQREPVQRDVALKVLKPGLASRDVVTRFAAERQALALMNHPNIARVFDGGSTDRGQPYFVMEFVDGEPITEFIARTNASVRLRLELFVAACDAVQHAHQKGVIHRDIKPNNVMVTLVDGHPTPKVIDFGIAKATGTELTEATLMTGGQLIGTPAYMSPEQVDAVADIDTRSDIYSLGVLLYEMLTETTPFASEELANAGLAEALRVIREVEPPRPSTRLQERPGTSITSRELRGDLDWIVMRCLEKDRERRYSSVAVLRNEIVRHLRGDPVNAGPPSFRYRLGKFVRKHRNACAAGIFVLGTLVAATIISWQQADAARRAARLAEKETRHAEQESARANRELARYRATSAFLEHLFASIEPGIARRRDTRLLHDLLTLADTRIDQLGDDTPGVESSLRRAIGLSLASIGELEDAEAQLRRALELRESAPEPVPADTLESMHDLGVLLLQMNRSGDALPLLRASADGRFTEFGARDERTLSARGQLAVAMEAQGETDAAISILEDVVATRREKDGDDHPDTLLARNNLASIYKAAGRLDEAEEMFAAILEVQAADPKKHRLRALMTYTNLAGVYREQGRVEEAAAMFEHVLGIKRNYFPPGHPSVLTGMHNLATTWDRLGRVDDARAVVREALGLAREHHGPDSHFTVAFRVLAAKYAVTQGDVAEAEREVDGVRAKLELIGEEAALGPVVDRIEIDLRLLRREFRPALDAARAALERIGGSGRVADTNRTVFEAQLGLALAGLGERERAVMHLEAAHGRATRLDLRYWRQRTRDALDAQRGR